MNTEYRLFRTESDGNKLRGVIATNAKSQNLGGFIEIISKNAFDQALRHNSDVICCVNHDTNQMLGRTSSGTLTLSKSPKGLVYTCSLPNTAVGRDTKELLQRGDLSQSSFGFRCLDDTWGQDTDGTSLRTVRTLDLKDVSVVANPAYLQSTAELSRAIPDSCPAEYRWLLEKNMSNQTIPSKTELLRQLDEMRKQIEKEKFSEIQRQASQQNSCQADIRDEIEKLIEQIRYEESEKANKSFF